MLSRTLHRLPAQIPVTILMSEARDSIRSKNDRFNPTPGRFVPSGVDAQSWIGFEHRIQERRFRALLETINTASARGDGISARLALEEARELRPDAPELADAEHRVALLPAAIPVPASTGYFQSRTIGAFALLLFGVTLLTALDFVRSPGPQVTETAAAPVATPALSLRPVDTSGAPAFDIEVPRVEEEEPAAEPVSAVDDAESPGAVGTAGVPDPSVPARSPEPAPPVRERAVDAPPLAPAAIVADAVIAPRPPAECPDDFIATQPRRESIVASPLLSRASQEPLLVRPPVVSAGRAAAPAVAPASAIGPVRREETLVSSVLDRYARAYDALDASAARAVWPSVDERALARAFAGLESQHVSFDDCSIDVRGETANASCRGLASYVGKVGSREPRTEPRQWTFELRRDGEAWTIQSAQTSLTP